jgi:hypothetical protein
MKPQLRVYHDAQSSECQINKTLCNFNWNVNSQNKHYNNSCPTNAGTDAVNSEWNFTYFCLPFSNTSRWFKTNSYTKVEWCCDFRPSSLENQIHVFHVQSVKKEILHNGLQMTGCQITPSIVPHKLQNILNPFSKIRDTQILRSHALAPPTTTFTD